LRRKLEEIVRHSMRGNDPPFIQHQKSIEDGRSVLQGVPVTGRAHEEGEDGCGGHVEI
jgi:hypothetical protein